MFRILLVSNVLQRIHFVISFGQIVNRSQEVIFLRGDFLAVAQTCFNQFSFLRDYQLGSAYTFTMSRQFSAFGTGFFSFSLLRSSIFFTGFSEI